MKKFIILIILFIISYTAWFFYTEIYRETAQPVDELSFEIEKGEDVSAMTQRLADEHVVRNAFLFRQYLIRKGLDTTVRPGKFTVKAPITMARVADALKNPSESEKSLTIIPGWNVQEIAEYFEAQEIATVNEVFSYLGEPGLDYRRNPRAVLPLYEFDSQLLTEKPSYVSLEGYIAPDTFRVYEDATLKEILDKFIAYRNDQFTEQMYIDIEAQGRTVHEVMTLASILEREVRGEKDKKIVSDLFWRRYDLNWALQADSTVHYAVGKKNDVYTTQEDRDSLSPWNTYRYPGLPPGPICTPSLESIMAAIYPTANEYWYFLTDNEGVVHYAKDLDEHNLNKYRWFD